MYYSPISARLLHRHEDFVEDLIALVGLDAPGSLHANALAYSFCHPEESPPGRSFKTSSAQLFERLTERLPHP